MNTAHRFLKTNYYFQVIRINVLLLTSGNFFDEIMAFEFEMRPKHSTIRWNIPIEKIYVINYIC